MDSSQAQRKVVPKKKGRLFLKRLAWFLLSMSLAILAGYYYEGAFEESSAQKYAPPGKMVDVGGYRMHINCIGTGKPTVVIESGWGNFSPVWGWVQPEVAKATRTCTYDRAWMGWSEQSSEPRTALEFAKELHTLLWRANEPGPYIMAGHSLGAYTVLVYAHEYPEEVAGLVFIDGQNLPSSNTWAYTPAPKPNQPSFLVFLARIAAVRLIAWSLGASEGLPEGYAQAYEALLATPRSIQTFLDEGKGMSEGGYQAKSVKTLNALPLIVLSRGKDQDPEWEASQKQYLSLSTAGQRSYALNSGHGIMLEQPKVVIDALLQMVQKIREWK